MDEIEFDVFPKISHIQQKDDNKFWNLTTDFRFNIFKPRSLININVDEQYNLLNKNTVKNQPKENTTKTIADIRSVLKNIKEEYPEYPVYKMFRLLKQIGNKCHERREIVSNKGKKCKKQEKQLLDSSVEIIEPEVPKARVTQMWTEKYRLQCSENIIGNATAVKQLKDWLKNWVEFAVDTNGQKRRRRRSSSEFESTDCDSRDSSNIPNNTLIVTGPCGSGKTASIYAICEEFGINVLELNASSKRTGIYNPFLL